MRTKKLHPALKHGGYSALGLLPGESRAEFEKLHRALISEFAPAGALEDDIVAEMAGFLWRKQNLATIQIAKEAQECYRMIRRVKGADQTVVPIPGARRFEPEMFVGYKDRDPKELKAAEQAAVEQARKDLGWTYEFVEIGEVATTHRIMEDTAIRERLDAMIEKCVKRLLLVRGVKSMSLASPAAQPTLIPAPPNAGEGMLDSARSAASQARRSRPDVRPQRLSAPTNVPSPPLVIATDDANKHDH
jgi:hypothetical protein